jgi:hypothetical protein
MATSGPITYLVMADQFPSVAVHEAPAPEYRMPGPPTGITRERACWVVTSAWWRCAVLTGQPRLRRALPVSRWRASLAVRPACPVNEPRAGECEARRVVMSNVCQSAGFL